MSALKHGFFRAGFMLCDRCVLNVRCERFSPDSECVKEKEAYDRIVRELTKQYELDGVADRILVWRAAMYLIRIARAETYESAVGVTEKSVLWGTFVSRLDNTLRGLLNDLGVTRLKRKHLEKGERLMVDLEDLLEDLADRAARKENIVKKEVVAERRRITGRKTLYRIRPPTVYRRILEDWRSERNSLQKSDGRQPP